MEIDKIACIYKSCGYNIRQKDGQYFLNRGLVNYSFPFLVNMPIKEHSISSLKWKYLITILKTQSSIKNTYEFLLETDNYSIENFSARKRNDIRKSLKDCKFKRPSLEDLFTYGLKINRQTLSRQSRDDRFLTHKRYWEKYITNFYNDDNIFILGAYIDNNMVGYITVCKILESFYIIDPYYDKAASGSSPVQGLIFTLVNHLIKREGKIKIYYGIDSFEPLPQLNKYKESMLFKRVSATRAYIINPVILPFFKIIVYFYLRVLKQKNIQNSKVRKMVRLLKGNRILNNLI
jgi:hypothetical protein